MTHNQNSLGKHYINNWMWLTTTHNAGFHGLLLLHVNQQIWKIFIHHFQSKMANDRSIWCIIWRAGFCEGSIILVVIFIVFVVFKASGQKFVSEGSFRGIQVTVTIEIKRIVVKHWTIPLKSKDIAGTLAMSLVVAG